MGASKARSAEMKGQNKMKKQSAQTTTSTIRATIEFSNVYEVIGLENALLALINHQELDEADIKELQRFFDLVEYLTGNDLLSYLLAKHN